MPEKSQPLIVAFVSGKGGVGKTMLAVSFAKEMSSKCKTLLIDLDFFNRGLTGLVRSGEPVCRIEKPDFLADHDDQGDDDRWQLLRVHDNLFHVSYPDLDKDDMLRFETLEVDQLKESLGQFIRDAAKDCGCDCVVLDCHGGPDNSSFAACLISNYTLLVSEPDRITFYGTLNFVRQLEQHRGSEQVDLRLVFNKVVPAFSSFFLKSFYDKSLKEVFSGKPLLGIFPLEVYLTKEFERTPFLTAVYPNSLLARKTRALIYDLLNRDHGELVSDSIKSTPKWVRQYRALSLGRTPLIINLNLIIAVVVTALLLISILGIVLEKVQFFRNHRGQAVSELKRLELLNRIKYNPDVLSLVSESPDWLDFFSGANPALDSTAALAKDLNHRLAEADEEQERIYMRMKRLSEIERIERGSGIREFLIEYREHYEKLVEEIKHKQESITTLRRIIEAHESEFNYNRIMERRKEFLSSPIPELTTTLKPYYQSNLDSLRDKPAIFVNVQTAKEKIDLKRSTLIVFAGSWLALALLISWSRELDRKLTYFSRQQKYLVAVAYFLLAAALWFGPVLLIGPTYRGRAKIQDLMPLLSICIALGIVVIEQGFRLYRSLRYEPRFVEDSMRLMFVVYLLLMPILMRNFLHSIPILT